MTTIKQLRDEAARLATEMRTLHERAERENRDLTAEEKVRWDRLQADFDAIEPRMQRAQRLSDLDQVDRPAGYRPADASADNQERRDSGWRDENGNPVTVLGPKESVRSALRGTYDENEWRGLSLGDFCRAIVSGPRTELERRALAGGSGSAGGYTVPTPLAFDAIDNMRAKAVCIQAGAQTVRMDSATLKIARLESDPVARWHTENADLVDDDVTFGQVTLTARTLYALIRASRELVMDSANAGVVLANAFGAALALEFDRAALVGTGTAPQPRGIANTTGVLEVEMAENGATLSDWSKLMDLRQALANANAAAPTAYIMAPRSWRQIGAIVDGENRWLPWPPYLGTPQWIETTAVPVNQTHGTSNDCSSVYAGDFSQMLLGLRMGLELRTLSEAFVGKNQFGFLAMTRVDVALAQPAAFGRLVGLRPT